MYSWYVLLCTEADVAVQGVVVSEFDKEVQTTTIDIAEELRSMNGMCML